MIKGMSEGNTFLQVVRMQNRISFKSTTVIIAHQSFIRASCLSHISTIRTSEDLFQSLSTRDIKWNLVYKNCFFFLLSADQTVLSSEPFSPNPFCACTLSPTLHFTFRQQKMTSPALFLSTHYPFLFPLHLDLHVLHMLFPSTFFLFVTLKKLFFYSFPLKPFAIF